MLNISWAGRRFDLLAEKALFWRDRKALIIADAHLGKAAAFRSAGIPVPEHTTRADLQRLDQALEKSRATRLIIVGDLLHARAGRSQATLALVHAWRLRHAKLEIVLVRGNHDHHAGDPPSEWAITCINDPWRDDELIFCHQPCKHEDGPVIAGHVHPCVRLHDVDGSTHRAACFLFDREQRQAIVPAFGSFTGTHPISVRKGDRVFVIGPDDVVEVKRAVRLQR